MLIGLSPFGVWSSENRAITEEQQCHHLMTALFALQGVGQIKLNLILFLFLNAAVKMETRLGLDITACFCSLSAFFYETAISQTNQCKSHHFLGESEDER